MQLHKPRVIHFEAMEQLNEKLESQLESRILDMSGDYGIVRVAFSGGESIDDVLKIIGRNSSFPFEEIELYQTDENFNTGANQNQIIKQFKGNLDQVQNYSFFKFAVPVQESINDYTENTIEQLDEEDGLFDILIIEISTDGSIAGLKPAGLGLDAKKADAIVANEEQVTLSAKTLLNCREIYAILKDDNDILAEILEGSKKAIDFPAKFLLAHPNVTVFYHSEF